MSTIEFIGNTELFASEADSRGQDLPSLMNDAVSEADDRDQDHAQEDNIEPSSFMTARVCSV
jgi:hypothetical protein